MAKSEIEDGYASIGVCPHMFFLFSDHLHQVCKRIYAISFAISRKIVTSKYNLHILLSIPLPSMIICNPPNPDHAQVKVGHTHARYR